MKVPLVRSPVFKKKSTIELANALLKLVNNLRPINKKFQSVDELLKYAAQFIEQNIMEHAINDPKYADSKYHRFLYMYSNHCTVDHDNKQLSVYIGITDVGDGQKRIAIHHANIAAYLLNGDETDKCDQLLAESMVSDFVWYQHIIIHGHFSNKAMRIFEDTTMLCYCKLFGEAQLLNINKGQSRVNFKEFGLDGDMEVFAVGGFILLQLHDTEPAKINPIETSVNVKDMICCPVDGCKEMKPTPNQFREHFQNHHATDGSVEALMEKIRPQCPHCGKSFAIVYEIPRHAKICKQNPDGIMHLRQRWLHIYQLR